MNKQETERLKSILSGEGYQLTKARIATFQLLVNDEPQTMNQILVRAKGTVDRVTVYRNVEVFEKVGIVHRIYIGWKYKLELSDQFLHHHHHLSCLACGQIIDIEDTKQMDEFIRSIAHKFSFQIRRHQLDMEGYCNRCQPPV